MSAALVLVRRELRLAWRQAGDSAMVIAFFVLATVLFPFDVGPEPNVLARISAGVLWVAALLAAMLSFERLFQPDFEDGTLDQLALLPLPLEAVVLAKAVAHWLTTGLPLAAAAPLLGILLNLPAGGFAALIATMALGTPTISLIGALGAALTVGARRGGVLLSLLVLPLLLPVLIFGAAGIDAALAGFAFRPHLMALAGCLVAALALAPWAGASALRQALH